MKFSIVIPAYNEAENIAAAIKALISQDFPRSDFEIIVVDDNSTDNTAVLAQEAGADLVIHEKKPGTNIARQAGLERAKGEIVAFLDADNIPPTDWLAKIGANLADQKISAVSGPYDYELTGFKKLLADIYNKYVMAHGAQWLSFVFRRPAGIIIGGNFATRQEVLKKIGGLPPLVFWGDDAAIAMLIARRHGAVRFDSELIVKSSPRRVKKYGLIPLAARYVAAYLKVFFSREYN